MTEKENAIVFFPRWIHFKISNEVPFARNKKAIATVPAIRMVQRRTASGFFSFTDIAFLRIMETVEESRNESSLRCILIYLNARRAEEIALADLLQRIDKGLVFFYYEEERARD